MIGRFKSALINAVSNTGLDASVVGLGGSSSSDPSSNPSNSNSLSLRRNSKGGPSRSQGLNNDNNHPEVILRVRKYEYGRPHFLQLSSNDEVTVTADHVVRPIIVPRDLSHIPWESGYAETINSGKSKLNEDQARVHSSSLLLQIPVDDVKDPTATREVLVPYHFFAVFDGHAGAGAAVAAAATLHTIVHSRLSEVGPHLVVDGPFSEGKKKGVYWYPQISVTKDSLIVGALEASFKDMDDSIREDSLRYEGVNGGCTATTCLFILGKVYTANAGDSRAIYCMRNAEPVPLSQDFTPETERSRVRSLAAQRPELLGSEFTSNEYLRRPVKKDVGTSIMYRGPHMTGWAYKTASFDDLKFPVVFGHGKRSRVLATIGVTRGFGDHDLTAHSSSTRIKPFLSSQPEVKIIDLTENLDEDSVIVMGTDGLWDVTSNSVVSSILFSTLDQFPPNDKGRYRYRYVSAAQDLVMHARGKFNDKNWKMVDGSAATIDDISVFVIPIGPYRREWTKTRLNDESLPSTSLSSEEGSSNEVVVVVNGHHHHNSHSEEEKVVKDALLEEIVGVSLLSSKEPEPDIPIPPSLLLPLAVENHNNEAQEVDASPTEVKVDNEETTAAKN